jgi:deoxyribodipyrimidine photolyase-related protein
MIVNAEKLKLNPRMALPYRTLERMAEQRRAQIVQESERFLAQLEGEYRLW